MSADKLAAWEQVYRSARKLDHRDVLWEHLERLDIDADPELLFEGTIKLVAMSVAYLSIDNRPIDTFLARQAYNPPFNPEAPYAVYFHI